MEWQHRQRDWQGHEADRDEHGADQLETATCRPTIERDRTRREREQKHRQGVVRLPSQHEVHHDGADNRPAERPQRAIADERHDSGDDDRKRHQREQDHVHDELRPRLVAPARRRLEEPVHARPAMPRLPDQVRDKHNSRDRHRNRETPRAQHVATPNKERSDQQDEDDRERVLRLQPDPGGEPEHRPRASPKREPQREPEHDHRHQLIERDRLEQQVRSQHPRREPDHDRRQRLRTPRRPELPGHEDTDHDRSRAREDREYAKTDQRPAEQLSRQRREQRRHRRKLDIPALKMQPGDGVIQLIPVPAVPRGDSKLQRALQRDDDENRPDCKRSDRLQRTPVSTPPSLEPQRHPRLTRSRSEGALHHRS